MTVHLPRHKLSYFSVPKVACTSLKLFFFELENGFRFRRFQLNGRTYRVHGFAQSLQLAKTRDGAEGHTRLTVVRDPWRRILSCYTSKILKNNQLRESDFTPRQKRRGLVVNPTLDQFVEDLDAYRKASFEVRHHTQPLSHFLGRDPAFYDEIYTLGTIPQMIERVAGIAGEVPQLAHKNPSASFGEAIPQDMLDRNKARIEERFAEDLTLYGSFM